MLTFSTGAFAPGVTVDQATYRMWAADAGIKWNGIAINAQYFMRWLDDFEATERFRSHPRSTAAARFGGFFCRAEKVDGVWPRIVGAR